MNNRIAGYTALERLEPCAGKLACTVLRGAGNSNVAGLLDFAFIGRQKSIILNGQHYYPDLIFYHTILKCYVIIDIKVDRLNHGDLGQMLFYVNYYDKECRAKDDNPTIGLLLCTEKDDALVQYTLDDKAKKIFASKYQFHLPSEKELAKELKKERQIIEHQQKEQNEK